MHSDRVQSIVLTWLLVLVSTSISASQQDDSRALDSTELPGDLEELDERQFARVIEAEGKRHLQTAIHTYVPSDPTQPTITLLGNIHVGTQEYFDAINSRLTAADMVLFEAPGRPRFLSSLRQGDRQRKSRAKSAGKYIAAALHHYSQQNDGSYPEALSDLFHPDMAPTNRAFLKRAVEDSGWGVPWSYQKSDDNFLLTSHGADQKPGGKKYDSDLQFNKDSKFSAEEVNRFNVTRDGVATSMSQRLGITDQGATIDYSDAKFILSDLDDVQVKSYNAPGGGSPPDIMGDAPSVELSDEERHAAMQRDRIQFINMNDPKKVPEIYGKGPIVDGKRTPVTNRAYQLAVISRNELVHADLRWLMKQDQKPKQLYILYGAGHMFDLESRLLEKMGYTFKDTDWLTALSAEIPKS